MNNKVIVIDSSCTAEYPVREHYYRSGDNRHKVVFKFGEVCSLAMDVAMKFNKPGFKLIDPKTNKELGMPASMDETIRLQIGPDEVIANYNELTDTALKMRAALKPGGENYAKPEVEREEVLLFLLGNLKAEAHDDLQNEPGSDLVHLNPVKPPAPFDINDPDAIKPLDPDNPEDYSEV